MSLGSEYPELLDEAFIKAIAARVVGKAHRTWHTAADEQRMLEEVEYTLSEMSCPTKDDPGAFLVYDFLCNLNEIGFDALDRFHEHWR